MVNTADVTELAIELARQREPDIALVDLRLRGDDNGLQAISRLRHLYPGLPALIVTGDTGQEQLQAAATAGVQLLSKPVLVGPLKRAIIEACEVKVLV